jgi:hypothetical protein
MSHVAFVQLASMRLWLRVNESTPWCGGSEVRIILSRLVGGADF